MRRSRGRPRGGGNAADQAREALLDAAERCLLARGPRAATMDAIAREAGYTRTIVYRHFATRDELIQAMVTRLAMRHMAALFQRLDPSTDFADRVAETFVVLATELTKEPIFALLWDRSGGEQVVDFVAGNTAVPSLVESVLTAQQSRKTVLRAGLRPIDAAHYLIVSAISLLRGGVPGSDDADQVRRFVKVFVLPGLLAEPPPVEAVFEPPL